VARDPTIGARIRRIRKSLKLTQQELGRQLGLTKVSVARYEAGRVPRVELLRKISQLGGVTVSWLLQGQDGAPPVGRYDDSLGMGTSERSAQRILGRLAARLPGNPRWSPQYRKRYERRRAEILLRAIRELEDFKKLLDATQATTSKKVGRPTAQ
jgi:transcriptional regulator with XRE-family HTH domain